METLKIEERTTVNFLSADKELDWRYSVHNARFTSMINNDPSEKTIYWIGAIDLEKVRPGKTDYPILVTDCRRWRLTPDSERRRYEDGAETGHDDEYLYDLTRILPTLLKARENIDTNYFHVFLEETADGDGNHVVNLLYGSKSEEKIEYGIATNKPWFELSCKRFLQYSAWKLSPNIKKILIMRNDAYMWHK